MVTLEEIKDAIKARLKEQPRSRDRLDKALKSHFGREADEDFLAATVDQMLHSGEIVEKKKGRGVTLALPDDASSEAQGDAKKAYEPPPGPWGNPLLDAAYHMGLHDLRIKLLKSQEEDEKDAAKAAVKEVKRSIEKQIEEAEADWRAVQRSLDAEECQFKQLEQWLMDQGKMPAGSETEPLICKVNPVDQPLPMLSENSEVAA